jgi:ubiquinone/menaquinone biosynthesis C-methylase UbiE
MNNKFAQATRKGIKNIFGILGYTVARKNKDFKSYIPFQKTLADAKKCGLSVGDYIEMKYNLPGTPQYTIDQMTELGVFDSPIKHICEIGPGSGRYLEKVMNVCCPDSYEIYETAADWKERLIKEYKVTAHNPNGYSLDQSATNSIDLVHTHKVLQGLSILNVCSYFNEMARVVRNNGSIVFDILTEECLSEENVENWLLSTYMEDQWMKTMVGKDFAINYFSNKGLSFIGSFIAPMKPGITQYFVFKKSANTAR